MDLPTTLANWSYFKDRRGGVRLLGRIEPLVTTRFLIVSLIAIYLILGPARNRADIVAATVASALLGFAALTAIFVYIYGRWLRRNLAIAIIESEWSREDGSPTIKLYSQQPLLISIKLSPLRVPAWFKLQLRLQFAQPKVAPCQHIILGRHAADLVLRENITFPHRGDWHLTSVSLCFGDYAGLALYSWQVECTPQPIYRIHPSLVAADNWPIISSAQRSGDSQIDLYNRQGDPFDLKSYHPSDGLKKIVWKVFAKSGELISRHPEASMTPEGQVALFCLAQQEDDILCGQALEYCRRLSEMQLQLFFGCQGMQIGNVAHSHQEVEDLLISTAWSCANGTSESLLEEFEQLLKDQQELAPHSAIERVLLALSLESAQIEPNRANILKVGETAENMRIKPIFLVTKRLSQPPVGPLPKTNPTKMAKLAKKWFTYQDDRLQEELETSAQNSFLRELQRRSWELFLIEF